MQEVPESYNIMISKIAHDNNVPVFLDAGGEDTEISNELIQYITILSPNETELLRLKKFTEQENITSPIKISQLIQSKYNKNMNILLKEGSKGCTFIGNKEYSKILSQPAMKIPQNKIIDTTGAGDTFSGAFMVEYIRLQKLLSSNNDNIDDQLSSYIIQNGMLFGCVAAGLSIQTKGTITSIPTLNSVINTILKYSNKK